MDGAGTAGRFPVWKEISPRLIAPVDNENDKNRSELADILSAVSEGDLASRESLMELVYDDLRRLAGSYLRDSSEYQTLQPTALVHEAFLKLAANEDVNQLQRSHFFAIAAKAMRQVLVSHFRKRMSAKRGGGMKRIPLDEAMVISPRRGDDVLAVDEAIRKLQQIDERRARVVEMRFFGGMMIEETAMAIGVSPRTIRNLWTATRAWLRRELAEEC